MLFLLLLLFTEPPLAQGENRIVLLDGSNPCEGFIGIYHDGKLGYVGDWNIDAEKVVCRSTHCGHPENSIGMTPKWTFDSDQIWINEAECNGSEANLWDCKFPGFGVSKYFKTTLKKITCSHKIKISLDGERCAGAVQYSTDNGKTNSGYFCSDKWEKSDADRLCGDLNCGTSKEMDVQWMRWESFKSSEKMSIQWPGMMNQSLWQSARQGDKSCPKPASVTCTGHERLQLKGNSANVCSGQLLKEEKGNWIDVKSNETNADQSCDKMHCGNSISPIHGNESGTPTQLTCSDNVTVVLMNEGKPSTCHGVVHVTKNKESHPVCVSQSNIPWIKTTTQVVCSELNCGKAIDIIEMTSNGQGLMDKVACLGSESSLWHCRAIHYQQSKQCPSPSIVCAGSVRVRLMDGLSKCAGRVEIQYKGKWQRVAEEQWTADNSDTVCRQLHCGNKKIEPSNAKTFSQGSGDFLGLEIKCNSNAKDVSECIKGKKEQRDLQTKQNAMGITCEGHKVVFLKGTCAGEVGIRHGEQTSWLSGSNATWNEKSANIVCEQMHCGKAMSFNSTPRTDQVIWTEAYSCSDDKKTLLSCKKTEKPFDHNNTTAYVNCSGNINASLSKECWGTVNVCLNGMCGGVCGDTWTKEHSVRLCKDLGCGDRALTPKENPEESQVILKSVHMTSETTNLTQCNFITNEKKDTTCNKKPAYVVCSGSVKAKFIDSRVEKCSGNAVLQSEGQWYQVCKDALKNKQTQDAVCETLKCGPAVKAIDYFGPKSPNDRYVSKIQCPQTGKSSLVDCEIDFDGKQCIRAGLQCSSWSKIELISENRSCRGEVVVHSAQANQSAVSVEKWTTTEGNRLCQDLNCGDVTTYWPKTSSSPSSRIFSCAGVDNPENIWDCEKETKESNEQLFIECQGEPMVSLSKSCHGEVMIDQIEVCSSTQAISNRVCQEMKCGNAVKGTFTKKSNTNKKYYHVLCDDSHSHIGQCKRYLDKCDNLLTVYCARSIRFNTTEKCGGQIQVDYEGDGVQEKVCPLSFTPELNKRLCERLGCHDHNSSIKTSMFKKQPKVDMETTLSCNAESKDLRYCVEKTSCQSAKPAEIYCNGYVPPSPPKIEAPKSKILPIVLGVGFFLVLVILIVVYLRFCLFKGANKGRKQPRNELAFESGDYDDVTGKANEMEELNRGRLISDIVMEHEERRSSSTSSTSSTPSIPYDDIDDVAQPLTSPAAAADVTVSEGSPEQNADGVSYEVADPQENYDDIEPGPEVIQTKAEVHDGPEATPESHAAELPVQGEEDYLVPDQDGPSLSVGRTVWADPSVVMHHDQL